MSNYKRENGSAPNSPPGIGVGVGKSKMRQGTRYGSLPVVTKEDIDMVAKSKTKKQGNNSGNNKKPIPAKQDILDMLASWCNLALESGVSIEQMYNADKGRFTVRIYGVDLVEQALLVKD